LVGQQVFLQILDQTGRQLVDQVSVQEKQIDLTFTGLPSGLYFLVMRIGDNRVVRKIAVSRS
jgi:hypothetical protein